MTFSLDMCEIGGQWHFLYKKAEKKAVSVSHQVILFNN